LLQNREISEYPVGESTYLLQNIPKYPPGYRRGPNHQRFSKHKPPQMPTLAENYTPEHRVYFSENCTPEHTGYIV
jgi:hypothetical protein